jgi:competence protein ComEA
MDRYQRLLILLLAIVVSIPVVFKSRPVASPRDRSALSAPSSIRGYVKVTGDVGVPGIYPFAANILAHDVISMALPSRKISPMEYAAADTAPLRNGEALHVRTGNHGNVFVSRGAMPAAERLVMGIPLDINAMTETDLENVPGIGPALARRITSFRQNNGGRMSVQDLLFVEGIGEKKFETLRRYF